MPAVLFGRQSRERAQMRNNKMLAETVAFDWSSTSAGPLESWPEALKVAARMVLSASTPMTMLIGREAHLLYNDAVRTIFGADYDASLGRPIFDVVPHASAFYRDAVRSARRNGAARYEGQPLAISRNGVPETAWFDLDIISLLDEAGKLLAVLVLANETTDKRRAARDLQDTQKRLSAALDASGIVGIWDLEFRNGRLVGDERFAMLFGLDPVAVSAGVDVRDILTNLHADDRQRAISDLDGSQLGVVPYRSQYAIVQRNGDLRWVAVSGKRVEVDDGAPERMTGVAVDITDQIETTRALEASEFRFHVLAEAIPQNVFSADPNGVHDYLNKRWFDFTGMPHGLVDTDQWLEFLHPEDHPRTAEAWSESLATGKTYDIEYRYLRHDGEYRWMRVMALPVRDHEGRITRWFGTATDIHETKLIEAERELIAGELNHRIKNLFAVVGGLISMSARIDDRFSEFADDLRQRLSSLAIAHDLIAFQPDRADHGQSRSLHTLMELLLKPYLGPRSDIVHTCSGVDVDIAERAITPVALIVHELATNAIKYGALAHPGGTINILTSHDKQSLRIHWQERWPEDRESGEPRDGFGSRMLATVVQGLVQGHVERVFHAGGLDVHIDLPLKRMFAQPV